MAYHIRDNKFIESRCTRVAYYTQYNVKENGRSTLRGLLTDKDRLIANIRDGDKDMQRDFIIRRMMFKLNNLIDFAKKCVTLNGEYNKIDTDRLYTEICNNANKLKKHLSKKITDEDVTCDFLEIYVEKINSAVNRYVVDTSSIFYDSFAQSFDIFSKTNIADTILDEEDCISSYHLDLFRDIKSKAVEKLFVQSYRQDHRDLNILLGTLEYDSLSLSDIKNLEKQHQKEHNIEYSINVSAIYNNNFPLSLTQRKMLNKVAVGSIDTIVSTNGAFDAAFIRYIADESNGENDVAKKERVSIQYLRRMLKYVKNNGYIFLTIPDGFIDSNIIKEIAGNGVIENVFSNEISYRAYGDKRAIKCYFLVIRKTGAMLEDGYSADTYREMYNYVHSEEFYNNENKTCTDIDFDLTQFSKVTPNEIKMFKGAYPDITSLIEELHNSTAFDITQHKFKVTPRPLLPFTKGQIGQILSSGNLDGIIDEGNGYKHIIRGKVSKSAIKHVSYEKVSNNDEDMQYIITEVKRKSNTVDINALDANGRFTAIRLS